MVKKKFFGLETSSLSFLGKESKYLLGGKEEGRSEVTAVIIEDRNDASG